MVESKTEENKNVIAEFMANIFQFGNDNDTVTKNNMDDSVVIKSRGFSATDSSSSPKKMTPSEEIEHLKKAIANLKSQLEESTESKMEVESKLSSAQDLLTKERNRAKSLEFQTRAHKWHIMILVLLMIVTIVAMYYFQSQQKEIISTGLVAYPSMKFTECDVFGMHMQLPSFEMEGAQNSNEPVVIHLITNNDTFYSVHDVFGY